MDRNSFQTHLRAGNGVHAAYLEMRKKSEGFLKGLTFPLNPLHHALLNIEKTSFEHPDLQLLFVNSYMVREQVLKFYSTDPEKVRVVHNGVEWSEMSTDFAAWPEKKKQIAADLNLDPNLYHFLFIGHNFQRKGLKKLLHALGNISRKDFHLSVIGEDKNLGLFREQVEHLNLNDKVTFFGSRSDIRAFYQLADALVIPSFYDPFANVTVEALAMGLFVVSSQTNGGHEILSSDNGAVIESLEDADAFTDALEKALKAPKTWERSNLIRQSVQYLDFPNQLNLLCDLCLS
jgi:UDP-glucose:(heptosyl)LPS alpha-1,3-glucosyltransferase